MICAFCKKELEVLIESLSGLPALDSAGVHEFIPGYGSRHDTTRFIISICDDCIDALLESKAIYNPDDNLRVGDRVRVTLGDREHVVLIKEIFIDYQGSTKVNFIVDWDEGPLKYTMDVAQVKKIA
jgi:hypothetical protein